MHDVIAARRFEALDGWRGICAVLVALGHLPTASYLDDNALVANAHLFVDFFFTLSGFVIAHRYGAQLTSHRQILAFMERRFLRLWPLHVALLLVLIVIEIVKAVLDYAIGGLSQGGAFAAGSAFRASAVLSHMLLIHSLGVHDAMTWNLPSWSISTEFYTYLVFALLTAMLPNRKLMAAVGLAFLFALSLMALAPGHMDLTHDLGLLRCGYGFFIGVIVHRVFVARRAISHMHVATSGRYSGVIEMLACLAATAFVCTAGRTRASYLAPVVFGIVIYVFASEAGRVSKLLRHRWLQALGAWSYSIYMVHMVWLLALGQAANAGSRFVEHNYPLSEWRHILQPMNALVVPTGAWALELTTLAYLALIIATASLTHRYIELPGQKISAWLRAEACTPDPTRQKPPRAR